ncbi:MAG: transporter substrate-binding domain-containing protein [Desulfobacterales bacterium]|nr:MAG: transporter substrate-binding domain-containing protein [Desulfobacterales bacterium]
MKKAAFIVIVLAVAFVFSLVSFNSVFAHPTISLLDEIQKRGVIKVGMFLQYPPTEYRDPVTKEPKGLNVDLANILAKDLKVKLEIVDMEWDAIIPGLLARKYDICIASMSRKPSRNLSIAFTSVNTEDYAIMGMVRPNETRATIADFNKKGTVITCLLGGITEHAARRFFPNAEIKPMQQMPAVLEVVSGRADMICAENVFAYNYIRKNPGKLKMVFEENPLSHEPSAISMRKGDQILLNWMDNWLQFQWDNRVMQDLIDKWVIKGVAD